MFPDSNLWSPVSVTVLSPGGCTATPAMQQASVPVTAIFRIDNMERFAPLSEGSKTLFTEKGPEPETFVAAVLEALSCY